VLCDSRPECLITSFAAWRRLQGASESDFDGGSISPEERARFWKYRFLARTAHEFKLLWDLIQSGQPVSSGRLIRDQVAADEEELDVYYRLFHQVRAEWREHDLDAWLAANPIYVDVAAKAVRWMQAGELAIVSTKDKSSILTIMCAGGFPLAESVVFATSERKDKAEFFAEISANGCSDVMVVDDHIENLMAARGFGFRLYLATWGYTSDEIVREAPRHGIEPLSISRFVAEL
jgi:phosphoglycolate phosphatase-like HAD superfamily hydrolase